jgi:hypothetical protein
MVVGGRSSLSLVVKGQLDMLKNIVFLRGGDSRWAPAPFGLARVCACLTWFEDATGGTEPWPFLERLASKMTDVISGPVSPSAVFLKRTRAGLLSGYREEVITTEPLAVTLARWRADPEAAFPDRIEFRFNDCAVCIVESEFWHQAGGPAPYHDSVTLSFYAIWVSADVLLAAARAAAHDCGASFEEGVAL